jgi:hypothetical protein
MYSDEILFPKPTLSRRDNAKVSEGIQALYVAGMGRIPVDGPIDVITREKARFTVALGWNTGSKAMASGSLSQSTRLSV